MGIKTFRETFGGGYIVAKQSNGDITIGSSYVHNLITIKPDLNIIPSRNMLDGGEAEKVYNALIAAKASGELERALLAQDAYDVLYDVYLAEDGKVVKKQCEAYEWPNTTTDGELLYDNTSFKTRKEALAYLREKSLYRAKTTFDVLIEVIRYELTKRVKNFTEYSFYAFRAWVLFGY